MSLALAPDDVAALLALSTVLAGGSALSQPANRAPAEGGRPEASCARYNAARNTVELVALAAGGLLAAAVGACTALLVARLAPVLAGSAGPALLRRLRSSIRSIARR